MREMLLQNFFQFWVFLFLQKKQNKNFLFRKNLFPKVEIRFFWQGSNFLQEEMGVNFENAILCRNKQKSF
jgi:hypothetical protein